MVVLLIIHLYAQNIERLKIIRPCIKDTTREEVLTWTELADSALRWHNHSSQLGNLLILNGD